MYAIRWLPNASKALSHLDKSVAKRIWNRVAWLAEHLDEIVPQRLTGEFARLYKQREGDYRILYEIIPADNAIVIHAIGHRREVYRKR